MPLWYEYAEFKMTLPQKRGKTATVDAGGDQFVI